MFSNEVKVGLHDHLPQAVVVDIIAATEGAMGLSISTQARPAATGTFTPWPGVVLVGEDGEIIRAGSDEVGMVALPGGAEGYFKDEKKTAATFKVIDGVRYTLPGDFATIGPEGTLTLLGRGSQCINSAGEKIFPEEVEEVLKLHPAVEDCLVFGVPDERFGQRVAAVVSLVDETASVSESALLDGAREYLASYKLPRQVITVETVPRTATGKPDYPAARELFEAALTDGDGSVS